jgi:hypothetical protein
LKQLLEQLRLLEPSVPILRERGVMRDLLIEAQAGKPAPGEMHSQFLDQPAFTGIAIRSRGCAAEAPDQSMDGPSRYRCPSAFRVQTQS